jgi:hypothetical protein
MRVHLLPQGSEILRPPTDLNLLDCLSKRIPVFLSLKIDNKLSQVLHRLPTLDKRAINGPPEIAIRVTPDDSLGGRLLQRDVNGIDRSLQVVHFAK